MTESFTPDDVLSVWCATTGQQAPRHPSSIVLAQCRAFSRLYRAWELVLVVKWLQSEIREAEGRGGGALSNLSLQFRNFFKAEASDDPAVMSFDVFEDRLQLARKWAEKRAPGLLREVPKPAKPAERPPTDAEREEIIRKAYQNLNT